MARKTFREKYGIIRASEVKPATFTKTGFTRIDKARGEKNKYGLRHGAVTVLYGPTGAGKSTGAYQIIGNIQRDNPEAKDWLVVDIENQFDAEYAESLGMDLDRVELLPVQEWLDQSLEGVRQAILSEEYMGVIVDSIHGQAVSRDDKSIEDEKSVAALSGKLTQFIQNTKGAVAKTGVIVLVIGQARDNMDKYGDKFHLTGGNQLKHDADMILQFTKSTSKTQCEGVIPLDPDDKTTFNGHITFVKVEKARGQGMGRRFLMPFIKHQGFSEEICLIEEVSNSDLKNTLFNTNGHHYKWVDQHGETVSLTGKERLLEYFTNNKQELTILQNKVMEVKEDIILEEEHEPSESL